MRIIAVTPGVTTGWAVWDEDRHMLEHGYLGPKEHHGELWNLLIAEWQKVDTLIYESWGGEPPVTVEYVGVIKAVADAFSVRLVAQGSQVKEWATNNKLRRWGARHTNWYNERQEVNAEKHILYFLCHNVYVPDYLRDRTIYRLRPTAEEIAPEPGTV